MAQVDFSNAHIEPYGNNPLNLSYSGLMTTDGYTTTISFYDAQGNTTTASATIITNDPNNLVFNIRSNGSLQSSGTELFIGSSPSYYTYRISNISFNSGDTFEFQFNASII